MTTETVESAFRDAIARAISRFVSDDSLKNADNFLFYLDIETREVEANLRKSRHYSQAEKLNDLAGHFRCYVKIGELSSNDSN